MKLSELNAIYSPYADPDLVFMVTNDIGGQIGGVTTAEGLAINLLKKDDDYVLLFLIARDDMPPLTIDTTTQADPEVGI